MTPRSYTRWSKPTRRVRSLLFAVSALSAGLIVVVSLFVPDPSLTVLQWLAPLPNREFGLIEAFQHLVLVCLILTAGLNISSQKRMVLSLGWSAVTLFLTAILFEEADYFLHYYDALRGQRDFTTDIVGFRNLHNMEGVLAVSDVVFWSLATVTYLFALRSVLRARPSLGVAVSKSRALTVVIVLMVVPLANAFGMMYPEDSRQVPSELSELALYASWGLLLAGVRHVSDGSFSRSEPARPVTGQRGPA